MSTLALATISMGVSLGCTTNRPPSEILTADHDRREAIMAGAVHATDVPAVVMGWVTTDGRTEFDSYGVIDAEDPRPIGPDSLFHIASMTKAVTAVAALQMVQEGRIGLDEPISTVLPEIKQIEILNLDGSRDPGTRPITLRDLLRHTAGFGYMFTSPKIMAELKIDPETGGFLPDVIEEGEFDWGFGIQPRRVFESGTDWLYGRNVGVAGKLVERLSGMDLETYFQKNILGPLGMTRSSFNPSPELLADRVQLMTRNPAGELVPIPPFRPDHLESFYGGGDLFSTPRDYTTFLRCLLNRGDLNGVRILDEKLVAMMMTDQLPDDMTISLDPMQTQIARKERSFMNEYDDGFSLGWAIETGGDDGLRPEGVGYWSGILNTYYTIDSERGIAIVLFSQMQPFDDPQTYELYRIYEDEIYRAIR